MAKLYSINNGFSTVVLGSILSKDMSMFQSYKPVNLQLGKWYYRVYVIVPITWDIINIFGVSTYKWFWHSHLGPSVKNNTFLRSHQLLSAA